MYYLSLGLQKIVISKKHSKNIIIQKNPYKFDFLKFFIILKNKSVLIFIIHPKMTDTTATKTEQKKRPIWIMAILAFITI
jgi:hypothetical protein